MKHFWNIEPMKVLKFTRDFIEGFSETKINKDNRVTRVSRIGDQMKEINLVDIACTRM